MKSKGLIEITRRTAEEQGIDLGEVPTSQVITLIPTLAPPMIVNLCLQTPVGQEVDSFFDAAMVTVLESVTES